MSDEVTLEELRGGRYALTFSVDDSLVDEIIEDAGQTPTGEFWEAVASYVSEDLELTGDLDFDYDDDTVTVAGSRSDLMELWSEFAPLTRKPNALRRVIADMETDGLLD